MADADRRYLLFAGHDLSDERPTCAPFPRGLAPLRDRGNHLPLLRRPLVRCVKFLPQIYADKHRSERKF